MTTGDGWDNILDPDETILWQGRPDGKLVFRPKNIMTFLFGLAFAGFALVWMILASQAGGFFWSFGLIHFTAGLSVAFGGLFWGAYLRRNSWYTLTDSRAFIATDVMFRGRRLKSYPVTPQMVLEFEPGTPPSVWFDEELRRSRNGSTSHKVGFERIAEGEEVYRMFRDVQRADK
ncbi:MAG: aspartate carbamoyltransferase catalytic subunit [Paracoccaceae bacterium]